MKKWFPLNKVRLGQIQIQTQPTLIRLTRRSLPLGGGCRSTCKTRWRTQGRVSIVYMKRIGSRRKRDIRKGRVPSRKVGG
jgi:hypothetical protein